jgi:hypothetical protein
MSEQIEVFIDGEVKRRMREVAHCLVDFAPNPPGGTDTCRLQTDPA